MNLPAGSSADSKMSAKTPGILPKLSFMLSLPGLVFPPLALAALVLGAKYRARSQRGEAPKNTQAEIGFVIGMAGTLAGAIELFIMLYLLPTFTAPTVSQCERAAMMELRMICDAQLRYRRLTGSYAESLELLRQRGFLEKAQGPLGYRFEMRVSRNPNHFSVWAHPVEWATMGGRHFYIDRTGVLRLSDSPDVGPDSEPVSGR